jgi:hypothetical protein
LAALAHRVPDRALARPGQLPPNALAGTWRKFAPDTAQEADDDLRGAAPSSKIVTTPLLLMKLL